VFVKDFERTGFTGGLNWYRNLDRDRELLAFLAKSKIQQPALFLAGSEDAVVTIYNAAFNSLEETMPNLTTKILIPSAGHWVQQEKPEEVNHQLTQFLSSTWPGNRGRTS
jgi:pimeloyl-ACP methyl ester carboxylesterase